MRRVLVAMAVALAALASPIGDLAAGAEVDTAAAEQAFVARINQLRAAKHLRPLAVHPELTAVARRWATSMARTDRISHNQNLPAQVRANWIKLGENVGVGMRVDELHDAFVASPTHYRNLVKPEFTHIGIGVIVGRDGALFTAHHFMQLAAGAGPVTAPAPTPAATSAPRPGPRAPAPAPVPLPPVAAEPVVPEAPAGAAPAPAQTPARVVFVLEGLRALDASR
jgi:hypothetical protein